MSKILTAEECLIKEGVLIKTIEESGNFPLNLTRDTHISSAYAIKRAMIEFAKLHVKAAIQECIESAPSGSSTDTVSYEDVVEALKDCYPLKNIK